MGSGAGGTLQLPGTQASIPASNPAQSAQSPVPLWAGDEAQLARYGFAQSWAEVQRTPPPSGAACTESAHTSLPTALQALLFPGGDLSPG